VKTALRDPAPSVRCQAVTALLRVQREAAARGLRGFLESDPDPRIRRIAARALGSLRAEEALRALEAARSDPDESVRHEVTRILKCIGGGPITLEAYGPNGGCRDIPTLAHR
jgi:HEAT repeat protein